MSDRKDFFFRQKVTEAELDAAFSNAEVADRFLASDLGYVGIAAGLVVSQQIVPNLTVQVGGPGVAYDQTGQRISIPSTQNLNCAVDEDSLTTAVVTGGNSRILSIFIEFDRTLSDPRIDGNSNTVYFNRAESFRLNVAAGTEGLVPTAPSLRSDQILIADITLTFGQTAIVNANISTTRREWMFKGPAGVVNIAHGTAEEAIAALVNGLTSDAVSLTTHLSDPTAAHAASAISSTPAGTLAATTVQAALNELDTEKLALAGGTMSGPINMGAQNISNVNALSGVSVVGSTSVTGATFLYTSPANRMITIPLTPYRMSGSLWVPYTSGGGVGEWTSNVGPAELFDILSHIPDGCVIQEIYALLTQTSANASTGDQIRLNLFRQQQNYTSGAATTTDVVGAPTYFGASAVKQGITLNPGNFTINKQSTTASDTALVLEVTPATAGASILHAIRIAVTDPAGPSPGW